MLQEGTQVPRSDSSVGLAAFSQGPSCLQDQSQRRQSHTHRLCEASEQGLTAVITAEAPGSVSQPSLPWLLWGAQPLYSGLGRGVRGLPQ